MMDISYCHIILVHLHYIVWNFYLEIRAFLRNIENLNIIY